MCQKTEIKYWGKAKQLITSSLKNTQFYKDWTCYSAWMFPDWLIDWQLLSETTYSNIVNNIDFKIVS